MWEMQTSKNQSKFTKVIFRGISFVLLCYNSYFKQNSSETTVLTCKQVLFIARVSAVNFILAMGAVSLPIAVPYFGEANS